MVRHLVRPEAKGSSGALHDDGGTEAAQSDRLPLLGGLEELLADFGGGEGLPADGTGVGTLSCKAVVVCAWHADGMAVEDGGQPSAGRPPSTDERNDSPAHRHHCPPCELGPALLDIAVQVLFHWRLPRAGVEVWQRMQPVKGARHVEQAILERIESESGCHWIEIS